MHVNNYKYHILYKSVIKFIPSMKLYALACCLDIMSYESVLNVNKA